MIEWPTQSGGPFHFPHRRIIVTGANGAGKTWFAFRLSGMLDLPMINNDALALTENWQYRAQSDIQADQRKAVSQPAWILEGGPSLIRPDITNHATCIIWLDLPASARVIRIFQRSLRYTGRTRPELPAGNVEWPGRRQMAFLLKAWHRDEGVRQHLEGALCNCAAEIVRLRSRSAVSEFLKCVSAKQC